MKPGKSRAALLRQLWRFTVTGGLAFVVDYGLLIALTELCSVNYLLSSVISFTVSSILNYLLSLWWVFDTSALDKRQRMALFVPFFALAAVGLGINSAMMYVGVEFCGLHYALVKLIATFVVMVFNFVTRKLMLERR